MSALAELSIFPLDKGDSLSEYVAEAVKIIESSGLDYSLGPMGTCIEGEWEAVLDCARRCMEAMKKKSNRIYMVMKVDYRADSSGRIEDKVESVKKRL
jgi:uncharacterized protein (TIGR00106 family)